MKQENQLTTHPVSSLIRQISIPASVGYFFNTMFNIVDTYFGGLISTQALAALSLSFPVFFVIIAMGSGLSTGVTALVGGSLGAGDRKEAGLFAVQGISFGILAGLILTLVGINASPFLFQTLGASHEYLGMCMEYMRPLLGGAVFFIINYMLNSILYAMGDTRSFRNFLAAGFLLNILLDPWFIYGGFGLPSMGIFGVALATVLIQGAGSLYLACRVIRTGILSGAGWGDARPRWEPFRHIARQGFPASVNLMTVGMGIFVITYFVSHFGKEAVAAYGIATRVEQILLLPTIGLNIATLSIVAQNHGAKQYARIGETVTFALKYGGALMAVSGILLYSLANPMMGLFTNDLRVREIGSGYLRIAAFVLYAYVILYVNVASLQGVKRPNFAIWIGLYRQIGAPVAFFSLAVHVLGFGLQGIWWGIFSITWSAAIITLLYARRLINPLIHAG